MELPNTVDNKDLFTKPNGDVVVDLTQQKMTPSGEGTIYDYFYLDDDLAMRPDSVALLAYGDITATDLILKSNYISNPFSIDKYDLIFVQERRQLENQFGVAAKQKERDDIRNQYIDPSKASTKDGNLAAFDERQKPKKSPKKEGAALPPNFAQEGEKEFVLRGGKVIFGADVTGNSTDENQVPLSKSEFLRKLAKRKANNT